jgi:putative transposase
MILSQWMGCARFVWNSKCEEHRYFTTYARKYYPVGTYAPVDQQYSQFKSADLSPWLSDCPSQILRNSVSNWYQTFQNFKQGNCGKPKKKKKSGNGSIHLTRELFRFDLDKDGRKKLFVGSKTNNIGYLPLTVHKEFKEPASIYLKKRHDEYWVSFCYEDGQDGGDLRAQSEHLGYLRSQSAEYLQKHSLGIDRGVKRPIQAGDQVFDLTAEQKRSKERKEKYIRRYQRRMARQIKGSKRRHRTKVKLSNAHNDIANIRKDFCHKASHALVDQGNAKIFILEDLKTKQMSKKAKTKQDEAGRFQKNGASAKSGLNKAILDVGWHRFEEYLKYKVHKAGKAWFKVPAHHTSQECAACGHTHPDNRKSQERFCCESCGHTDNADHNAAEVIKKRAIRLILHSGTELSKRGVLSLSDTGRGAKGKTGRAKSSRAPGEETSKKKRSISRELSLGFVLEAAPL